MVPEEWELCLDSWILLTRRYLMLPAKAFAMKALKDHSIVQFLVSYVQHYQLPRDDKTQQLRKGSFLLLHRIMTEVRPLPPPLSEWDFLANLSMAYAKSKVLSGLLNDSWNQIFSGSPSIENHKRSLIEILEATSASSNLETVLMKLVALLRACYRYGQFLMLGSDLIDSFSSAYERVEPSLKKKIATVVYFCLTSLMGPEPKISTLLDHLYSLKATPLIKAVVETTPLLQRLRDQTSGQDSGRTRSLIESLKSYEKDSLGRTKKPIRRKIDKGKGRANDEYGHGALGDVHVHRLSLVSQVQDLFPDLGSGFIVKLLDEYNDDTALVTDHLLNDDLPVHLKGADRSEELTKRHKSQDYESIPDLAPRSTPPLLPTRRNIHDDDDFDRLAINTSKLRFGKKEEVTADKLLASERPTGQKAAILAALAAFDSDDDERDDTYDVGDVGGTVDTTNDEMVADLRQEVHEEALFNAYNMTPELFNRDAETRRGKPRAALKAESGMTDEAIEGWAIMVGRDPRRLKRLEAKFDVGLGGQRPPQRALENTAWRADSGTEGTEDSDVGGGMRSERGGRGRGRGRGRGQGRGGGNVAGPADDQATQAARQRKDASKGSRANHNRRDQRARKMARGGFPG